MKWLIEGFHDLIFGEDPYAYVAVPNEEKEFPVVGGKGKTNALAFEDLRRRIAAKCKWSETETHYRCRGEKHYIYCGDKEFEFATYRDQDTKEAVLIANDHLRKRR